MSPQLRPEMTGLLEYGQNLFRLVRFLSIVCQ